MNERVLHILLIEDDIVDVMNVKRALQKNNISNPLYVAENGVVGLQMLRDGSVPAGRRLVLLDLNLPKMKGIEFLREVRADPELESLSVVVLTTSKNDQDLVEAYKLNVAGYLIKPIEFIDFVQLMASINKYWALVEMP